MADFQNTYWNNTGKHQRFVDDLSDKVPEYGYTSNVYVNIYLVMSHLYYDAYNNGGGNIEDNYTRSFHARVEPYLGDKVQLKPFLEENFEQMESMMNVALEFIQDKNLDFPIYSKWCNHDEMVVSNIRPVDDWAEKGYWFNATFGEPEELNKFCSRYKDITNELEKMCKERGISFDVSAQSIPPLE